jgi:hypothetical protein
MAAQLFDYAIILEEVREKGKVTEKPAVLKRGDILTDSRENALILISREIPEEHLEHLERITLAVRPF